ncbi:ThuA domain-containing protein [Nonomuraea endophytica]|uniref:Type 1 glutamine amidotransferase n=1 Tax=Nonomuraea endophytica TaxID=714136 RepID=A0A7W8EIA0_9ACTN|nr:ThuA domain-containing protein [Nonomuraea endophytica]MBB5081775.1 type 1 glutamine amidotransferase [Nonomuraea endophytica]
MRLLASLLMLIPMLVAADPAYQVLVFSKTAGFRHDSIPAGVQAIRDLGAANNFTVTATETWPSSLSGYRAVIFLNTTGDVLDNAQQSAFESYINGGGGYVGVHAAADTEYNWPFYGQTVGAYFSSHPAIQQATVRNEDRAHAATAHLGATWTRTDEWYNYRANPRSAVRVLQNLDEGTYSGGDMGDHPITWCHTRGSGRAFYTGLGHTQESYSDPAFRALLLGGIRYAAGMVKADCRPESGYTPLMGSGWSQAGPGGFTIADGTWSSFGGMGLRWHSAKEFSSYSLKLDWRMAGDDNSGVFVGFPPSGDPNSAVNNGYEVQIDATDTPDRTTGSIYGFKAPDTAARDAALNPPGAWNAFELLVEGERLQVFLNGVKVNDFTNTDPSRSLLQGHIGLQNHGEGDDVAFRNIRIKELGGGAVEGESYTSQSGVQPASHAGASGGRTVGYIDNGDWAGYSSVSTAGATGFTARVSSGGAGGTVTVRSGSQTGPVLGSVTVPGTGGWDNFQTVSTTLNGSGTGPVFLTFSGGSGSLFDVDTFSLTRSNATTAEGESCSSQSGVQPADHANASAGRTLGYIENGDWAGYSSVSTAGATGFSARISSGGSGGAIQIRSGSQTGTLLGQVTVPVTGGWENFQTVSTTLTGPATGPLFLVFTGGAGFLFDLDTLTLTRG